MGLRYLDGAFNYEERPARDLHIVPEAMAAPLVWLDALVMNIDRTHRNPNLLVWQREPWLIDHGAALYFHHNWASMTDDKARATFPMIASHLFLEQATALEEVDADLAGRLPAQRLAEILAAVPDVLLEDPVSGEEGVDAEQLRARYLDVFVERLQAPRDWVAAAAKLRDASLASEPTRLESRR